MTHPILCAMLAALAIPAAASAQPARFDDVVRNLRHPEPKVRLAAVRLLREAKYPEAIVPISQLVLDPVDERGQVGPLAGDVEVDQVGQRGAHLRAGGTEALGLVAEVGVATVGEGLNEAAQVLLGVAQERGVAQVAAQRA